MMGTQTLIFIFFSLCGVGIFVSLTAPVSRQGNVLAWLGCLAAMALVLAGGNALLGGDTFLQPLWSLPGLTTLTLALDRLSAVFLFVTGPVLFPASIFAGGELRRGSNQENALAAIAFVAGLYHLINHSLYKTLLFFGVGTVETQTGTCDMDRLGGLIKWMPLTALGFLAGTLSIAALPPFNGFVSEWLTLQTMLRSAELSSTLAKIIFALCGAGLALTAALAVTCL